VRMLIERVAPGLYSTDDRDERWFKWKDRCYRACEKPARLQGVVFYSMGWQVGKTGGVTR